ncbi:type VI secretion system-associated FHA domain protein TagH, partial [Nevskia sp.]|uniref:type VI secretion system-associated FHA domain protein TagH n=1 Tax=Nevskia sp. TaxID=1929292 RepID=UPI0025E9CAE6
AGDGGADTGPIAVAAPEPAPPSPAAPSYAAPLPADDPFDFDLLAPMPAATPAARPGAGAASTFGGSEAGNLIPGWDDAAGGASDLDPLSFLGPADGAPMSTGSITGSSSWNHSASTADSFRPPSAIPQAPMSPAGGGGNTLPDNWDLTMGDFAPRPKAPTAAPPPPPRPVPPPPRPTPAPPAAAPSPGVPAGLPPDIDQIFRTVVDGVMDVLRARAEIKNTFRLPVTIIQRSENNPLKFAPTPEDALARIMSPPSAGFLSGTAAFDDAFNDIRCHQMAMLAGIRAAFETMVQQFSPDRFEQDGEGAGRRSGFMDFAGKGKYWEKYREHWDAMNRNPDERFRRLFGEEFAKAYEEQLSRLKSARRMQQAGHR